ncbi:MAG: tetratricopeptide repeat protein [bacterium]|nr:tetratricopeptide repeat protein [bacterium]
MKILLTSLITGLLVFHGAFVLDDSLFAADKKEVVVSQGSGSKRLLDKIWGRIRTLYPPKTKKRPGAAVAGIKGAEKGSEDLKPLWKGDIEDKRDAEIEAFSIAEELAAGGKCSEALVAFANFGKEFPASSLAPNVQFISAICCLSTDRPDEAARLLNQFIADYPDHDLSPDAAELLESIK